MWCWPRLEPIGRSLRSCIVGRAGITEACSFRAPFAFAIGVAGLRQTMRCAHAPEALSAFSTAAWRLSTGAMAGNPAKPSPIENSKFKALVDPQIGPIVAQVWAPGASSNPKSVRLRGLSNTFGPAGLDAVPVNWCLPAGVRALEAHAKLKGRTDTDGKPAKTRRRPSQRPLRVDLAVTARMFRGVRRSPSAPPRRAGPTLDGFPAPYRSE